MFFGYHLILLDYDISDCNQSQERWICVLVSWTVSQLRIEINYLNS